MSFNKQIIDFNFSSKVSEYNLNANIQKNCQKLCKIFVENIDKKIPIKLKFLISEVAPVLSPKVF